MKEPKKMQRITPQPYNSDMTDYNRRSAYTRLDEADYRLAKVLAEDPNTDFQSVADVIREFYRRGVQTLDDDE